MILFIHGYGSSGDCQKCQLLKEYYAQSLTPSLDLVDIKSTLKILESYMPEVKIIIGASFGGFYAHYLALKYQKEKILINPVVDASKLMMYVDENRYNHNDVISALDEMTAYIRDKKYSFKADILLGLNDTVINAKESFQALKLYPCKFYQDDHRMYMSFKSYLNAKNTLLNEFIKK